MKAKITVEQLLEAYLRLITHLINRRQIPNADLDKILEPLKLKMKAGSPGLFVYEEDEKES